VQTCRLCNPSSRQVIENDRIGVQFDSQSDRPPLDVAQSAALIIGRERARASAAVTMPAPPESGAGSREQPQEESEMIRREP
jgi:hypothetical protein